LLRLPDTPADKFLGGVSLCRPYYFSTLVQLLPALIRAGDPVWSCGELCAAHSAVFGCWIAPVTLVVVVLDLASLTAELDDRLVAATLAGALVMWSHVFLLKSRPLLTNPI
jgi:hypothetical protein